MATELFKRDTITYGEVYDAVLAARTPDEARETFAAYVGWLTAHCKPEDYYSRMLRRTVTVEEMARENIGYLFGYGGASKDQIAMWELVTGSVHPLGFV